MDLEETSTVGIDDQRMETASNTISKALLLL